MDLIEKHFKYSDVYNEFVFGVEQQINNSKNGDFSFLSNINYSFVEWSVLGMLFITNAISMSALANMTRLSPSHLSIIVSNLEEKGLVCRFQKENNRRTNYVKLTETGLKGRQDQLNKRTALQMERFNNIFTDNELEQLNNAYDFINGIFCKIQQKLGAT